MISLGPDTHGGSKEKSPRCVQHLGLCDNPRQRPTLPRTYARSTIGGSRLNFRVRNGNGCGPAPMTTGKPIGTKNEERRTKNSNNEPHNKEPLRVLRSALSFFVLRPSFFVQLGVWGPARRVPACELRHAPIRSSQIILLVRRSSEGAKADRIPRNDDRSLTTHPQDVSEMVKPHG